MKTGEERTQAVLEAGFHAEDWRQAFRAAETVGRETVEEEPCYKVVVTPHQGEPSTQFFSVKSGLLLKTVRKTRTPKGEVAVEEVYKDYRKAGDILLPHTTIQSFANQFRTTTIRSVAWNTAIPKEKFAPPAEVQALLKK